MTKSIKVIFFASFKETLGCSSLELELGKSANIEDLCLKLADKGEKWKRLFADANKRVKVAVNQQMADLSDGLNDGDEVAFFPPVTGG